MASTRQLFPTHVTRVDAERVINSIVSLSLNTVRRSYCYHIWQFQSATRVRLMLLLFMSMEGRGGYHQNRWKNM